MSEWKEVLSEVSQGSVLPLVMFLTYKSNTVNGMNSYASPFVDNEKTTRRVEDKRDYKML